MKTLPYSAAKYLYMNSLLTLNSWLLPCQAIKSPIDSSKDISAVEN